VHIREKFLISEKVSNKYALNWTKGFPNHPVAF